MKKAILPNRTACSKAAGRGRLARRNIELQREAHAVLDVHRGDRKIRLVVRIPARPVLAHGHSAGQIARLKAAIHSSSGRVQDVEFPGHRVELGAEYLISAAADDEKRIAGTVAIDGDDVVGEGLGETWRWFGVFYGDLLVQVDVFARLLRQSSRIDRVDQSLNVHVEYLGRLGLCADVRQPQTVAAHQRRQKLVGKDS